MSWTDGVEYTAQDQALAAVLNTLKGNLDYLHLPNYAEYRHPGTGSDYTTTVDAGQDIDGTNFNLALTTYGNPALVMAVFHGIFNCSSGSSSVRVNMVNSDDVISFAGRNLYSNYSTEMTENTLGMGWIQWFLVPPGVHHFKAIWGIYGGGTATLQVKSRPYMGVWEL